MGGYGEGGHTYDAQQFCNEQEVGKMHIFKFQVSSEYIAQLGVHSGWKNESLQFDPRFCFYLTRLYDIFDQLDLFPFFLVWRRLRCR